MHPTGRAHLLGVYGESSFYDPSLEPFIATAADAYCYRAALGDTRSLRALRPMALIDRKHQSFASRLKVNYEHIKEKFGRRFKQFEMASLEAYLLSPLMAKRPKIVRISRAKNLKPLYEAESITDGPPLPEEEPEPPAIDLEPVPATAELPPATAETSPTEVVAEAEEVDVVTPIVKEVVWATPAAYEADLPAATVAALINEAEFAEIAPEGLSEAIVMKKQGRCAEGVYVFSEVFVKEALETRATEPCEQPVPKCLGKSSIFALEVRHTRADFLYDSFFTILL